MGEFRRLLQSFSEIPAVPSSSKRLPGGVDGAKHTVAVAHYTIEVNVPLDLRLVAVKGHHTQIRQRLEQAAEFDGPLR